MGRNGFTTSVRFMMVCDVISPHVDPAPEIGTTTGGEGQWVWRQDEESGALIKEWVEDDPTTPDIIEGTVIKDVPLFAEGILDGGIRVAGTTERFDEEYQAVDWVKAVFPKDVMISRRDKISNIRNRSTGEVLWKEDEIFGRPDTVFNVMGVTPVLFLGKLVENAVLLERAEVQ